MAVRMLTGDCRQMLAELPDESVHCVVTSPPYYGLRSYGGDPGMIGLEPTLDDHIANLVDVFAELWRVLRADGVLWLNYGDAYSRGERRGAHPGNNDGLKAKDLMMIPARVAMALQAEGWWVRSRVVWHKKNPMPSSASDRPTNAHEDVYLLAKSGDPLFWVHRHGMGTRTKPAPDYRWIDRETGQVVARAPENWRASGLWRRVNLWRGCDYYYDADAVRTAPKPASIERDRYRYDKSNTAWASSTGYHDQFPDDKPRPRPRGHEREHQGFNERWDKLSKAEQQAAGANLRDVWSIATVPYKGAHFATFPPDLCEPPIKASTSEAGVCPECGAPWARHVERAEAPHDGETMSAYANGSNARNLATLRQAARARGGEYIQTVKTLGWFPTCDCDVKERVPAVVLDPFGGAGTVGLVAERLGRDSVLVEVNAEYAEMARRRIFSDAPLFAEID